MGRVFLEYLPLGSENDAEYDDTADIQEADDDDDDDFKLLIFACRNCGAHLTRGTELISKDFRGRSGKAYLFSHVLNLQSGTPEDRLLMTGMHTTADVFCFECNHALGWKYLHAFDERQRYKVGKVILEAAYIKRFHDGRPRNRAHAASTSSSSQSSSSS